MRERDSNGMKRLKMLKKQYEYNLSEFDNYEMHYVDFFKKRV
jgi:hypothetical protein